MESSNALSIFKQMPENKAQLTTFLRCAKDEILSGEYNPLEIKIRLKYLEEMILGLSKDEEIMEMVIEEAEKYPEKTVKVFGCEVQKRETSTYNWKYCNDSTLELLELEAKRANEKLKERQEFLKLVQPNTINGETGEILNPPLKSRKTGLAIKIL